MAAAQLLLVIAAYIAGAQAGLLFTFIDVQVTVVWPPAGIAVAVLLVHGKRLWPGVFIGAWLANIISGVPWYAAAGIATGNTLEAIVAIWLFERFDFSPNLARIKDVIVLLVLGVVCAPAIAATAGMSTLYAIGRTTVDTASGVWLSWWTRDGMGVITFAPLLVQLFRKNWFWRRETPVRLVEFSLLNISLIIVVAAVFTLKIEQSYIVFPFIIWSAIRFGRIGVEVSGLVFAITAVMVVVSGNLAGLDAHSIQGMLITLTTYVGAVISVGLFLGVHMDDLRAADVVRQLSEQVHDLYNNAPSGYHSLDANGRVLHINDTELQWLGYRRDEVVGKHITEFMDDETREKYFRLSPVFSPDDEIHSAAATFLRSDGSMIRVMMHTSAVHNPDGTLARVKTSMVDVSEQYAAKLALSESQYRFNILSHSSLEGVLLHENGVILAANQAIADLFDVENPEALIGRNGFDILPVTQESLIRMRQTFETGISAPYEIEVMKKDGTLVPMEMQGRESCYQNRIIRVVAMRDITERKKAESILRELVVRLEKIASQVPGMIYQFKLRPDGTSCFPYSSHGIRNIYRVSPEDVADDASAVFAILHPDDYNGIVESIQHSAQNLTLWNYDYRVKFGDGTVRWLHGNSMPERQEDGCILWHGYILDITERKSAEARVLHSEIVFRQIIESSPIAMLLATNDFVVQYLNLTFTRLFGYTIEDIPTVVEWWPRAYPDVAYREYVMTEWNKRVEAAIHSGNPIEPMEATVMCKDGSMRIIEFSTSSLGERVLVVFTDITQRKKTEQDILLEHARLQLILDTVPMLILGLDVSGYITIINRAGCTLLGRKESDLTGKLWFSECLLQPAGMTTTYTEFLRVMAGKSAPSSYFEETIVCSNGEARVLGCSNSYMSDSDGRLIGTLICGEDISERKKREEEEERLVQLRKERHALEARTELLRLAQLEHVELHEILAELLPTITRLLNTEYASYWQFNNTSDTITCLAQYCNSNTEFLESSRNVVLRRQDCPMYFDAINSNHHPLVASDARNNPATSLFTESYFKPLNIFALLDVHIWHRGGVRGVICVEDIERPRFWTSTEIEFAESAGRVLTYLLEQIDRIDTQIQLSQTETKFTTVFNGSLLPILIVKFDLNFGNDNQVITDVNPAFESAFGLTKKDVVGKNPTELDGRFRDPEFRKPFVDDYEQYGAIRKKELTLKVQGGEIHTFLMSGSIIYYENEPHLLVILQDIQEQKNAEAAMEEAKILADVANKTKSEFLANISHEIRTPMNAILGYAELLKHQQDEQRRLILVDSVISSGNSLMTLINNILDLAKIESSGVELFYETINLRSLFDYLRVQFYNKAVEKKLDLVILFDEHTPLMVYTDVTHLRQILYHLLDNAVKFTEKGRVTLSSTISYRDNNTCDVNFIVNDTGIGIHNDVVPELFEAFRQQEGDSRRKFGGMGLGLAIVRKLTQLLGGVISVESMENQGTTITVSIPDSEAGRLRHTQYSTISPSDSDNEVSAQHIPDSQEMQNQNAPIKLLSTQGMNYRDIRYLAATFSEHFAAIKKVNSMPKHKKFAMDLAAAATTLGSDSLLEFANVLLFACERFDVAKVTSLLDVFETQILKHHTD